MIDYTQEEREAAAKDVIVLRHGNVYANSEWGKREAELVLRDCAELIEAKCDLTRALDLLWQCWIYSHTGEI